MALGEATVLPDVKLQTTKAAAAAVADDLQKVFGEAVAKLQAGDRLYVNDTPDNLNEYEALLEATLHNVSDTDNPVSQDRPLSATGQQLAEVVLTRGSLLHHDYDGIREYDNPMPKWWVYIFIASILFAFPYLLHYHFGKGLNLEQSRARHAVNTSL